jgi:hypothetical protein
LQWTLPLKAFQTLAGPCSFNIETLPEKPGMGYPLQANQGNIE